MQKIGYWFFFLMSLSTWVPLQAQKYFSREGVVSFDATVASSPETIAAEAKGGVLVVDAATGALEMGVLLKNFLFKKALMQEHFNENYVESSKYPKATFKGTLADPKAIDWKKDGAYTTTATGTMNLHGVTKPLTAPVTITIKGGKITGSGNFPIVLADYNITIPTVVAGKLAKQAKVKVNAPLTPMP